MSRRLVLLSFADTRYRVALERLKGYTQNFPFDERHFLTERDLPKEYIRKLKPWLYRRGYGYWSWKSFIVLRQLERMSDGDILFYSDGGLYWNDKPKAMTRFNEYVEMLKEGPSIMAFEEGYPEYQWTKGDVLEALGVYDNEKIYASKQFWGGLWAMRKTPEAVNFVKKWLELSRIDRELVTDKRSITPNKKGFIEHRHDQSIFSCMVKLAPHIAIPHSETSREMAERGLLNDYPIQARRMKEQGRPQSVVLKNKLLHPWRILLYHYFTRCRGYHFATKSYSW